VRAGELGDRAGDLLEQGLEVELLRDRPIDVREGADRCWRAATAASAARRSSMD
jgi:hypothetical protein